jgi:hypothetical protein
MIREMLPLEVYIEEFCAYIDSNAALITNAEGATEGNWFQYFAANWRGVKNHYLNELARKGVLVPQAQTQTQNDGIQHRGMIPEEMMADEPGFNAVFSTDFWAVDFIPPWYGAVPMGNGNNFAQSFE